MCDNLQNQDGQLGRSLKSKKVQDTPTHPQPVHSIPNTRRHPAEAQNCQKNTVLYRLFQKMPWKTRKKGITCSWIQEKILKPAPECRKNFIYMILELLRLFYRFLVLLDLVDLFSGIFRPYSVNSMYPS